MQDSPITFRPGDERELLDRLQAEGNMTATAVLKQGLRLMAAANARGTPSVHPMMVDDLRIEAAVEEAAEAACEVLGALFKGRGPAETHGISSNFIGLLGDHIRAMLTGREHANKPYCTPLPALLSRWDSFGRVYPKNGSQGVTIMRPAMLVGEEHLYFNGARFVPLDKLQAGDLFTSMEYAVEGYIRWLEKNEESPKDRAARLVLIDFSGDALLVVPDSAS